MSFDDMFHDFQHHRYDLFRDFIGRQELHKVIDQVIPAYLSQREALFIDQHSQRIDEMKMIFLNFSQVNVIENQALELSAVIERVRAFGDEGDDNRQVLFDSVSRLELDVRQWF